MSSKKGSRSVNVDPDWFEVPHIGYWLVIIPSMAHVQCLLSAPHLVPYDYLGPIGTLSRYLVDEQPRVLAAIYYGMIAAHIGEGAVAYLRCRKLKLNSWTTFKWTVQTVIIGFSSLFKLGDKLKQKSA